MRSLLGQAAVILGFDGPLERQRWHRLRYAVVVKVRSHLLQAQKSVNTINATLAALKGVLKSAFLLGRLPVEEWQRIAAVPRVSGQRLPAGRRLTQAEVAALFRVCLRDKTASGARDGALIGLMVYAGLRRSEVVGLQRADYTTNPGRLLIHTGKGCKDREVALPSAARKLIQRWLGWRGRSDGPLFVRVGNGDMPTSATSLSSQALYDVVKRRSHEAKILSCSPHDLRRTFITRLLEVGIDLNTTRQLAGHEDIQTTARYDRRAIAVQRRALARLQY